MLFRRNRKWVYDHLEAYSFAELFAMKQENEERLQTLRRKEPGCKQNAIPDYVLWVGRNVECIDNLKKIQDEILYRKTRAVTPFRFDGNALML